MITSKCTRTLWLAAVAAVLGCATGPRSPTSAGSALNSESIKARFGSYDLRILEQKDGFRVSDLYSTDENNCKRTRTLAYVEFDPAGTQLAGYVHTSILTGASIGSSLKAAGYRIVKSNSQIGLWQPPPGSAIASRFAGSTGSYAMYRYDLGIETQSRGARYARLLEIYDPAYLTISDLGEKYPDAGRVTFPDLWEQRIARALKGEQARALSCD